MIARDMVDSHYLPRAASGLLERALAASPVIVLMGARQTGKSTLVRSEPFLQDRLHLTLDDPETREHARMAAGDLVRSAPRLTLDEVQREPDLLLAVKRAVSAASSSTAAARPGGCPTGSSPSPGGGCCRTCGSKPEAGIRKPTSGYVQGSSGGSVWSV